jgi:Xaa-Pro aminopeptidase
MPPMAALPDPATLPPTELPLRLARLRDGLDAAGCDALVVSKLANICYLTGFTGSAATLVVTRTDALVLTDGRYRDQIAEQVATSGSEVAIEVGNGAAQREALQRAAKGIERLGLEAGDASWARQQELAALFEDSALVATTGFVEALRLVKDAGEVARIEQAAGIADVALAQVKQRLLEDVSESEFAAELDFEMRRRGAEAISFETIVASGPNGARPHARPTDKHIVPGELVVIDFGALYDGYHSDMTRTLCVGEPSSELSDLVDAVFAAQRAGVRAVRAGARAGEVDSACRESLTESGYGEAFLHGTGHGVGLEIHEAPSLGPGSADTLDAGAVVTVEPGAYLPGVGGARIEDTIVVTDAGARALTKSTKDLTL